MKKAILLLSAGLVSLSSFAQDQLATATSETAVAGGARLEKYSPSNTAAKGAGLGPTIYYTPYATQRTGPFSNYVADRVASSVQAFDSGRLNGINVYNYKGFAQYYDLEVDGKAPVDTSVTITGVVGRFGGVATTSSSKSAVFSVWKRDFTALNAVGGRTKYYIGGAPQATTLATKSVPLPSLNLTAKGGDTGSTVAMFTTPISGVNYEVYVGYTIAYTFATTAGDTVGLSTVPIASGAFSGILDSVKANLDTVITAYSLVQNASGAWKSNFENVTGATSTNGNLVIYPIVKLSCPTCGAVGVPAFTRNNLQFFGNYPNPAVNATTVKYGLKNRADVTVTVYDMAGRTMAKNVMSSAAAGEHLSEINVSSFAAGTYVYLIETSDGDGFASQFTVAK